jgi:hypothetical protein
MIKEAEENALADKGKKAITNVTYELDNLLSKADIILEKNLISNSKIEKYFSEILIEIKESYNSNKLTEISNKSLDNLKYVSNVLLLDSLISKKLNGLKKEGNPLL